MAVGSGIPAPSEIEALRLEPTGLGEDVGWGSSSAVETIVFAGADGILVKVGSQTYGNSDPPRGAEANAQRRCTVVKSGNRLALNRLARRITPNVVANGIKPGEPP